MTVKNKTFTTHYQGRCTMFQRLFVRFGIFATAVRHLKHPRDILIAGITQMHRWPRWITPNRLSVARIVMVLPVLVLMLAGLRLEALMCFTVGSVSDLFDGPLARLRDGLHRPSRRMGGVSALGSFLDPMADKIMVVGVSGVALSALLLTHQNGVDMLFDDDTTVQSIYQWMQVGLLGATILLEFWSAIKRIIDYLDFRAGLCGIERLRATNEGKYKALLQFFATGGYVLAEPWSLLLAVFLLAGSIALAVKSLWAKYRPLKT